MTGDPEGSPLPTLLFCCRAKPQASAREERRVYHVHRRRRRGIRGKRQDGLRHSPEVGAYAEIGLVKEGSPG